MSNACANCPSGACSTDGKVVGSEACWGTVILVHHAYHCDGSEYGGSSVGPLCPCDAGDLALLTSYPDGSREAGADGCSDQNCGVSSSQPEACDGVDGDNIAPFDEGCGDDENKCGLHDIDADNSPVRFSSGRVETNPITLFQLPTPEGIFFGVRIQWGSHVRHQPALARSVNGTTDTNPTIHDQDEFTHFLGQGWQDEFSDRLYINVKNKQVHDVAVSGEIITWQHRSGTVAFTFDGTAWKSTSGKYELWDRCNNQPIGCTPPPDTFGRWIVRTTDTSGPREAWAFEEIGFGTYSSPVLTLTLGRLRRHVLLTSTLTNLTGRYGYDVNWATTGEISSVIDTLGRELDFTYSTTHGIRSLSSIQYKPGAGTATEVVSFQMTMEGQRLERVEITQTASYTRFLYNTNGGRPWISDVIVPGDFASTSPAVSEPIQSTEIAMEHDEYTFSNGLGIARYSKSPGREYAYDFATDVSGNQLATQFDLHRKPGDVDTPCGTGCPTGYVCRAADSKCYAADQMQSDKDTRLPTAHVGYGGTVGGSSGNTHSFSRLYVAGTGALRSQTDPGGYKTSYGYDSLGRLRCVVRNDDNDDAFADTMHPDTSACAGPTASQIIQMDYSVGCTDGYTVCMKKTTPSLLSGTVTDEDDRDATSLLAVRTKRTGNTHDIDAMTMSQSQTMTMTYDSIGRLTETNGPLTDSVALDKQTTSYYTTADGTFNFGNVHQRTVYVGTSTSNTPLTTTYEQYDQFGVPHKVTDPNGDYVTYCDSEDRKTWKIARDADCSQPSTVAQIVRLNPNGTLHSVTDEDGVCVTYEYTQANTPRSDFVGAPTRIRRAASDASCAGTAAIDITSGEVEIRTYKFAEADRLESITRKRNNTTEFTYPSGGQAGFKYDLDRRLISATTLDSTSPGSGYSYSYTDVIRTGTTAPGGPAAGTWKTETNADAFGRPGYFWRYLDAANKQTFNFSYANNFTPRPTQLTRGYNGNSTSVTTFVYDDFARVVEVTVPEAGAPGSASPTRYEYDVAGRMTKRRVGVGTSLVRTDNYTYDSLGRTTFVDHDSEHPPPTCTFLTAGTPIEDEEYKYDGCAGDVPSGFSCTHALGRLTIARTILQCGTANQVKRGRWYDYDSAGRVSKVAYAVVNGTIGTPVIMDYTYSSAGRLTQYRSPLNSAFGTKYTLGSSDGRVTTATTSVPSGDSSIASFISYRAFGPMKDLTTASSQPVGGGAELRTLGFHATYRNDNSLDVLDWTFYDNVFPPTDITVLHQHMGYTAAGVLTTRIDDADANSSRYYGYDALLRMTCEARGRYSGSTPVSPSSSDCVTTSSYLSRLLTFGNGESATSPQDARLTSFIRSENGQYVSPVTETSSYSSGSSQLQSVTRNGVTLTIQHDAIGRRSYDYDSNDLTRSRRDYVYLPNGQLGTISGRQWDNQSYTVKVLYDERGRPLTMTDARAITDSYEFYWDDTNRLVAVQITPTTARNNVNKIRWHYHYINGMLVAMTREMDQVSGGTQVKRFWAVQDERGMLYRLTDEVGATYWQSRTDSGGASAWVGTPQPEMWVPFALAGQIRLEAHRVGPATTIMGTEANNGTWSRPPLSLNGVRTFDALLGQLMSPDPRDQTARLSPEGYAYGRNNPIAFVDPDGALSVPRYPGEDFGSPSLDQFSCDAAQEAAIREAINQAMLEVSECALTHTCGGSVDRYRRIWLHTIASGHYYCLRQDNYVFFRGEKDDRYYWQPTPGGSIASVRCNGLCVPKAIGATAFSNWAPGFPVDFSSNRIVIGSDPDGCLAHTVAHEAGHGGRGVEFKYQSDASLYENPWAEKDQSDAGADGLWTESSSCLKAFCKRSGHPLPFVKF